MSILDEIARYKREEIAAAKAVMDWNTVRSRAKDAPSVRPFLSALKEAKAQNRWGLIAEIKKASPSKGLIRADFNPAELAKSYQAGGATCLSVLTDIPSFQGAPAFLEQARGACDLPVLRKDFMFDPYQVAEARAWGADCILIIMAAVSDLEAQALEEEALAWNMDVLLEVHDEAEMARVHRRSSRLVGINNRDLRTFETSLAVTERLAGLAPHDAIIVSESGLSSPVDLHRMKASGVSTFLIGESLMRHADVAAATKRLLEG